MSADNLQQKEILQRLKLTAKENSPAPQTYSKRKFCGFSNLQHKEVFQRLILTARSFSAFNTYSKGRLCSVLSSV